jgi:cell division septation protein DedD
MPPELAANTEKPNKRIPLVWIPATLGIGLSIAAIYLRGRIVTAHPQAKPEVVYVAKSEVKEATPPTEPVAQTTTKTEPAPKLVGPELPLIVTSGDAVPMIEPQAGERYIQVGAMNLEATRRLVQRLRENRLEPHVAAGPKPELMRILIGPFDDRDALNEKKAQLESEGVDTFVRQY